MVLCFACKNLCFDTFSHLTPNLLEQLAQLRFIRLLRRPLNPQPLLLVRLGNHVEMHVVDLLMRNPPVVLQDVVVLHALGDGNALCYGEHFGELVVGYVVEFCAVVLGDDEL